MLGEPSYFQLTRKALYDVFNQVTRVLCIVAELALPRTMCL